MNSAVHLKVHQLFAVGAISAKLMLTSSAAKHIESRVTTVLLFILYVLVFSYFDVLLC